MTYIGRFAPSPTGPLHFGSLIAALASFLDARKHQGLWLLRIEDLDPLREQADCKDQFADVLEHFGLYWDDEITFQSERLDYYQAALETLTQSGFAYLCNCSRKTILARSGSIIYDGHCRHAFQANEQPTATRIKTDHRPISFKDAIQGYQSFNLDKDSGDFVVLRRDHLFAYQLAVVVDDYLQGITHVVRGSDLLNETPKQILLQQYLGYSTPHYCHIPVVTNAEGQKLSKQTYAEALNMNAPEQSIITALAFLGQNPPDTLQNKSLSHVISWAIDHWDIDKVPSIMGTAL